MMIHFYPNDAKNTMNGNLELAKKIDMLLKDIKHGFEDKLKVNFNLFQNTNNDVMTNRSEDNDRTDISSQVLDEVRQQQQKFRNHMFEKSTKHTYNLGVKVLNQMTKELYGDKIDPIKSYHLLTKELRLFDGCEYELDSEQVDINKGLTSNDNMIEDINDNENIEEELFENN